MIDIGIVGASGYAGEELNTILSGHSKVRITYLAATSAKKNSQIKAFNLEDVISKCSLVFFALPHTESMKSIPHILAAGKKVIDLGADYRLKNISEYKDWYKIEHLDKNNIEKAVYGLPEVYRDKIKRGNLIANPGCYPTAAILALLPIFKSNIVELDRIVIDAKSGISGAGKKSVEGGLTDELKNNVKPYKVNNHQHMPEIDQELSLLSNHKITVDFVPHLLPVFRGLLATVYIKIKDSANQSLNGLLELYKAFYADEAFVRVVGQEKVPQIKDVVGTNFCDIGISFRKDNNMLVVVSVIDNLIKGAAGQAVQNMNLIYGFKETEGLIKND